MKENDINRILSGDTKLREAISRHERKLPPMPAALNDHLMQRIRQQDTKHKSPVWLYSAIGVVAASVLLLLILEVSGLLQESSCSNDQSDVTNSSTGRDQFVNWTCPIRQSDVTNSSTGRDQFVNWTCPIRQSDVTNSSTGRVQSINSTCPINQPDMSDSSKVQGEGKIQVEKILASTEKNEVVVAETTNVFTVETVDVIPPDRQALADIYLAETALQVAYERLAQMDELRAYTIRLETEESQSSQPIVAF